MAKPEARVLVLFLTDSDARGLFQEMVNSNVEPGYFQIIASDSWGTRTDFIPELEAQAIGKFILNDDVVVGHDRSASWTYPAYLDSKNVSILTEAVLPALPFNLGCQTELQPGVDCRYIIV